MRRYLLAIAAVVFVFVTAATALTQVQPGERAVVRRFGRILPDHPAPGLHVGWPWGIDRVDRVPIGSVRRVEVGFRDIGETASTPPGQMLTGDHNLINVRADIDYVVREDEIDGFLLLANQADALIARAAESVLAEWVAGRTVDDALLRGKGQLPAALVEGINRRLAPYKLGVRVEQASLPRLNPPDEVREAFERVSQAQTTIRTQTNQAEQLAKSRGDAAKAEQFQLKTSANSYANDQILRAAAEAAAFNNRLTQYRQLSKTQPDYLNVLWLDEMTRLFAKLRETGHVDLLDHHLGAEGLNITQFPLATKKK